jgi:dGTPase
LPASLAALGPGQSEIRDERRDKTDRPGGGDQRTQSQRDRDRVLNTSAFRRLAGVTQVVSAAEGEVFHNRLTHSLEVAQIGRRIAEHLTQEQASEAIAVGGLDPETVEAACLAHDLGHPPFGHIAENELNGLITDELKCQDGFEGNPQSLRILTKLSARHITFLGLNLTRATLDALLKYPWPRALKGDRSEKWGAYQSELDVLEWVRQPQLGDRKCLEAELMDWADDIAYAVHDAEDFYRAGLVPFDRLSNVSRRETVDKATNETVVTYESPEIESFVDAVRAKWAAEARATRKQSYAREDAIKQLRRIFSLVSGEPYEGTYSQRSSLRTWTSSLIGGYVRAIHVNRSADPTRERVIIDDEARLEVDLLKELTWFYVIQKPALTAQQFGQRRVVKELFGIFHKAACAANDEWVRKVLPNRFGDVLRELEEQGAVSDTARIRFAADAVVGLTEQQALDLHSRLTGHDSRSVFDPIVI